MPLVHHELCFGCGRTNLFGLMLEVERTASGSVAGRCFIKQDHQGYEAGLAHPGIVATAVSEAMAFACGEGTLARTVEVQYMASVPVGAFLEIEAHVEGRKKEIVYATAVARVQ